MPGQDRLAFVESAPGFLPEVKRLAPIHREKGEFRVNFDDGKARCEGIVDLTNLVAEGKALGRNAGLVTLAALGVDLCVPGFDPVVLDDEGRRGREDTPTADRAELRAGPYVGRALPGIEEMERHVHPGTGTLLKPREELREVRGNFQTLEPTAAAKGCPDPAFPATVYANHHRGKGASSCRKNKLRAGESGERSAA